MAKITVDMFAVELGLAVLLQFKNEGDLITVLADAGSKKYEVHKKLDDCLEKVDGKLRIDLMIGTHYDGDHLNGLVDIIRRDDIEIGEAWLPPVANDTEAHLAGQEPQDHNLLGLQFVGEQGEEIFERYLKHKANTCNDACKIEREYDEITQIKREQRQEYFSTSGNSFSEVENGQRSEDSWEVFFEKHLIDAYETLGVPLRDHADHDVRSPTRRQRGAPFAWQDSILYNGHIDNLTSKGYLRSKRVSPLAKQKLFAYIRKSAAKDAITAGWLKNVVKALHDKGVKMRFASVDNGQPRRFYWHADNRRFTPVSSDETSEPTFILLGPSRGLIQLHWDRLPVVEASAMMFKAVPYEDITPSNELSYIGVFEYAKQRILISGDAGCVDFSPNHNGKFYQDLINELDNLDVVQVAHHAGHNAHFYHSLLASNFPNQKKHAYLLLSHRTYDDKRPSDAFNRFIDGLGKAKNSNRLIFTSTPLEEKVRDYKELIAPIVGSKSPKKSGDIKLEFDNADWKVISHYVEVK